ncbi:MAG: tetratricopeptide repeat protein [Anaerolineae bacterium]
MELTSFVGRGREIAAVTERMATTRLLTLTGAGGCGKTRLAHRVASELLSEGEFEDGVCWVNLVSLAEPELVPQALASALGVHEQAGQTLEATLAEFLAPAQCLLVLDNCEHLLSGCVQLIDTLLRGCPDLEILATSRIVLGTAGETVWPVPPLSLSNATPTADLGSVDQSEAVRLFVERARAADPEFELSADNAADVAEICRRLDGVPLAVELAAARVRVLSVGDIAAHLDEALRLLTHGPRTGTPHHQTMRATIDWSRELLGVPDRALLDRLSVFSGGFTWRTAEAVCAGDNVEPGTVLDLLFSLADQSLVEIGAEDDDGTARCRLLEIVRQYSAEKLAEEDATDAVCERHLAFFLALAQEAEPELRGPDQLQWLARLSLERDNFRAALKWALADKARSETGLRLAAALRWYWYMHGHLTEGRRWLARALEAAPDAPAAVRANALNGAGTLAYQQGDFDAARALYEDSLATYREVGDEHGAGLVLGNLGMVATDQADYASGHDYFTRSLDILVALDDRKGIANALGNLGHVSFGQGDLDAAETYYERSMAYERELGSDWGIAASQHSLGQLAIARSDHDTAQALLEEALAIYRIVGDKNGTATVLSDLSTAAAGLGADDRAKLYREESLSLFRELERKPSVAEGLYELARLLAAEGQLDEAERLLGESLALSRDIGEMTGATLGLIELGEVVESAGDSARAVRLWGAADRQIEDGGVHLPATVVDEHHRHVQEAKRQLGDAAFEQAWGEGRAMTLDAAVAVALRKPEAAPAERPATDAQADPTKRLTTRQELAQRFGGLTAREREVAALLVQGQTNQLIADELVVALKTVEGHVTNILSKLGFERRAQVAAWAVANGLAEAPQDLDTLLRLE